MKKMLYLLITLAILFIASQIWAKVLSANIEMHEYEVLAEIDGIEIRKYAPATFSYVTLNVDNYDQGSSMGFRKLAGYIFGGNQRQEKIAMTSPVEMAMDTMMVVKFMVPAKYNMEDLPTPNNKEVRFVEQPERIVAAIRFSGFANDEKIARYREQLKVVLNQNGLSYDGEFSFLGYNSPFDLINRRNEVIVSVDWKG